MKAIRYTQDEVSLDQAVNHLNACSEDYFPPLADRVDIQSYAQKILSRATTFEAWCDQELVGFVAAYLNESDPTSRAFVTNVSVVSEYRGQGIAKQILMRCHSASSRLGNVTISLEVDSRNEKAIGLYHSLGYRTVARKDSSLCVLMNLEQPSWQS